ncbi:MAG: hypothetical protein IKA05_04870 [Clostridia bacterium]|nr:hypothetical protein [Clostridia bacterium]
MKYIPSEHYAYIMNKYHDQSKPFDPHKRFIRRDEIFSEATGLSGEEILNGILEQDERLVHLPHPVRKARALAYVLKNTRIACDRRDRFPAIHMVDRPLNATLIKSWKKEVFEKILPEVNQKIKSYERAGIVTIWPDFDHSTPVWDRVLELGFAGLLRESERARQRPDLTSEQNAFFEGIKITYEAILDFVGRLADLAATTEGSERLAAALKQIQYHPPKTFYEALLVDYLYFMICEHIEGLQVRSLSNFDRLFFDFYKRDRENGISEEELRTDLAHFFLQFTAIGNYWNQPVYLGGERADGTTEINELSYVFLDVYDQMGIYNPKIQIKVAKTTPKPFLQKALDMIRRGNNSIVFVSDATIRAALLRNDGATEEEARLAHVTGCYEYGIEGEYSCGMNYLNLLKPLEYALHEGCDGVTGEAVGRTSPSVSSYETFDELYAEYKKQLLFLIDSIVETVNSFEDYLHHMNPQSMLSATFPNALKRAKDALAAGTSALSVGFVADVADSLAMIKKHVFDNRELSLQELVQMLDRNFEGCEPFRRKLLADRDKYGNNRSLPDSLACDIIDFVTKHVSGRPNAALRGGHWHCGFHVARMSYTQGAKTAASANGRRLGEELSKNCSASMGQCREGATAAILSVTKIDATSFVGDACLDLGLLPTAVRGDDGLEAMYGLLMTFCKRGGHALHINVFDADTLRDAQEHPDRYQDLQIRVCGWNVLWNNINKEEQDGFIRQAEALIG